MADQLSKSANVMQTPFFQYKNIAHTIISHNTVQFAKKYTFGQQQRQNWAQFPDEQLQQTKFSCRKVEPFLVHVLGRRQCGGCNMVKISKFHFQSICCLDSSTYFLGKGVEFTYQEKRRVQKGFENCWVPLFENLHHARINNDIGDVGSTADFMTF